MNAGIGRSRRGRSAPRIVLWVGAVLLAAAWIAWRFARNAAPSDARDAQLAERADVDARAALEAAALDPERDDRVEALLAPCTATGAFLEDTSDMLPVLVSKLAAGDLEPQKRAKEELALLGAAAIPELERAFEKEFANPTAPQRLQNVLGVLALMDVDAGRKVLLRALEHPHESVRMAGARGLQKHSSAADYDRLRDLLPISGPEMQVEIGKALYAADRRRLERDLLEWLAEKQYPPMWSWLVPRICDTTDPDVLARMRELYESVQQPYRFYLQGALARAGDAAALAGLREAMRDESQARRKFALQALDRAGLWHETTSALRDDRDETVRLAVATALAEHAREEAARRSLLQGMADHSREVRKQCLAALIAVRDESAIQQALELLKGDRQDLEMALGLLRSLWLSDPAEAERGLVIIAGLRSGEIQPLRVDRTALERALAQVPLERAAAELYRDAQSATGMIQGLRAHRWYLHHAGNTGPLGRAYLRSQWQRETDPLRRMDIVTATSYDRSDEEREFLMRILEDARSTPIETLYAADLLAALGPANRVAPLLKRVTLRVDDPRVRPALNCLLWRWFGVSE